MSSGGAGGEFWKDVEHKRKLLNEKKAAWNSAKKAKLKQKAAESLMAKPPPMDDPLPDEFHGLQNYELGPQERFVLNTARPLLFKWLAIVELERVVTFWKWQAQKFDLKFPVTRSNVIRLMAQIEWRVRKKVRAAMEQGTAADDPFCALVAEAIAVVTKLPCPGAGRPGRIAGLSPYRHAARLERDFIDPEALDNTQHET
jgi:hypothetical protein